MEERAVSVNDDVLFERGILTGEMFLGATGAHAVRRGDGRSLPRNVTSADEAIALDRNPIMKVLNCLRVASIISRSNSRGPWTRPAADSIFGRPAS